MYRLIKKQDTIWINKEEALNLEDLIDLTLEEKTYYEYLKNQIYLESKSKNKLRKQITKTFKNLQKQIQNRISGKERAYFSATLQFYKDEFSQNYYSNIIFWLSRDSDYNLSLTKLHTQNQEQFLFITITKYSTYDLKST